MAFFIRLQFFGTIVKWQLIFSAHFYNFCGWLLNKGLTVKDWALSTSSEKGLMVILLSMGGLEGHQPYIRIREE